jgi:predicted RNA-binding Zn-ribbon protein involved in translation (DUF1610 family)
MSDVPFFHASRRIPLFTFRKTVYFSFPALVVALICVSWVAPKEWLWRLRVGEGLSLRLQTGAIRVVSLRVTGGKVVTDGNIPGAGLSVLSRADMLELRETLCSGLWPLIVHRLPGGPASMDGSIYVIGSAIELRIPLWLACVGYVWSVSTAIVRSLRSINHLKRGACASCGYDLRASVDRCPECGTAIEPARSSVTTAQ